MISSIMMVAKPSTHLNARRTTQHHHNDEEIDEDEIIPNQMQLHHNLHISNWSTALQSLHSHPTSASIWIINRHGRMLPLHAALLYGAPSHVTLKILQAYPIAAREKDLQGRLPIHIAASMAAILAIEDDFKCVLNELVRSYPESLWVKDDCGRSAMELVEILQLVMHEEEEEEEEEGGRQVDEEEMKPSLKCVNELETKFEKKEQCHDDQQQQYQYQQQSQHHKSKLVTRKRKQHQKQQKQDEYKSIYDLLSQGIAPSTNTIPHAVVSTEKELNDDDYPSTIKETMSKVFSVRRKEGSNNSDNVGSVERDKPLAEITITAKVSQQEEGIVLSSENNTATALHRVDNDRCHDDVTHGLPSSSDKADDGLSPCTEATNIFSNLGSFDKDDNDDDQVELSPCTKDTNIFSNLGSFDNKDDDNDDQVLSPCTQDTSIFSNLGIQRQRRRRKRRKNGNGTLTDLVSTIGSSMSFESIGVSYSKSKKRKSPVPRRQCDCCMCSTAAEIKKEMDNIRRELHAFDLVMPTLLLDYLVASHWDNVMSRIRNAPSEVKAWARKEVHGKVVLDVLPLHAAIVLGAPSDVIIALVNAYPSGAGEIDGNRSFPIHLAASCLTFMGRGDLIVDHLLNAFRSGKHAVDANGRTPSDIVSIISTSLDHGKDDTTRMIEANTSFESNVTLKNTFEEDAALAHLVQKAMTNLNMSLKYQYSFLRQASARGIETIDDLLMADDDYLDTLFSEKELTVELRRLLSLFIEGRG